MVFHRNLIISKLMISFLLNAARVSAGGGFHDSPDVSACRVNGAGRGPPMWQDGEEKGPPSGGPFEVAKMPKPDQGIATP
jgi:hypothetical protein